MAHLGGDGSAEVQISQNFLQHLFSLYRGVGLIAGEVLADGLNDEIRGSVTGADRISKVQILPHTRGLLTCRFTENVYLAAETSEHSSNKVQNNL